MESEDTQPGNANTAEEPDQPQANQANQASTTQQPANPPSIPATDYRTWVGIRNNQQVLYVSAGGFTTCYAPVFTSGHAPDPAESDLSDAVSEVFDNGHLPSEIETQSTTDGSEDDEFDEEEWDVQFEEGAQLDEDDEITPGCVSAIGLFGCLVVCIAMTMMRVNKLWAPALPQTPAMFIEALDQIDHFPIEPLTNTERDHMISTLSHEQRVLDTHMSLIDFDATYKGATGATRDLLWNAVTLGSQLETTINALEVIPTRAYGEAAFKLAHADSGMIWLKNQTTSRPLTQVGRDLDHLRRSNVPGLIALHDIVADRVKAVKSISDNFDYAFRALHTATPLMTMTISDFKEKACDSRSWEMAGSLISVQPEHALLYMTLKDGKAALESACQLADRAFTLNAMYTGLPNVILASQPSYDVLRLRESAEALQEMIREGRQSGQPDQVLADRIDQEIEATVRDHGPRIRAVRRAFPTFH